MKLIICAVWIATSVISVPPAQFDRPYAGRLTTVVLPSVEVHKACRGPERARGRIMACAMLDGDHCIIIIPMAAGGLLTEAQQARLVRHEVGHCNGWLAGHAGASFAFFGRGQAH